MNEMPLNVNREITNSDQTFDKNVTQDNNPKDNKKTSMIFILTILVFTLIIIFLSSLFRFSQNKKANTANQSQTEKNTKKIASNLLNSSINLPNEWSSKIEKNVLISSYQAETFENNLLKEQMLIIPLNQFNNQSKIKSITPKYNISKLLKNVHASTFNIKIDGSTIDPVHIQDYATSLSTVNLIISADSDTIEMRLSEKSDFSDTNWEPYSRLKPWKFSSPDGYKTIYAEFKKGNNQIIPYSVEILYNTSPPWGGIYIANRVIGNKTINVTVYFGFEGNFADSNNASMMISTSPDFNGGYWEKFVPEKTLSVNQLSNSGDEKQFVYVKFRNNVGIISETFSDSFTIDRTPPYLQAFVKPINSTTGIVQIYAYDELSNLDKVELTNDSMFREGIKSYKYSDIKLNYDRIPEIEWTFDSSEVVALRILDSSGNKSEIIYVFNDYKSLEQSITPLPISPSQTISQSISPIPSQKIDQVTPTFIIQNEDIKKIIEIEYYIKKIWPGSQKISVKTKMIDKISIPYSEYQLEYQDKNYFLYIYLKNLNNDKYAIVFISPETQSSNDSIHDQIISSIW